MSDWYCSSVAWTAVTAWSAALTATVGMLRRQSTTPTIGNERVWRCTTGGTTGGSEPSWTLTKGSTTSDNGVVWTEVTGNSAHQQDNGITNTWAAPHARIENMLAWMAAGDRGFASSDHTQTRSGAAVTFTSPGQNSIFVSVDRATGNIPPLAADITAGAAAAMTANSFGNFSVAGGGDWSGFTFTGSTGSDNFQALAVGNSAHFFRFRNCTFVVAAGANNSLNFGTSFETKVRLDSPTFSLGATGTIIGFANSSTGGRFFIENAQFSGTLPHVIFQASGPTELEVHSSDFSAFNSSSYSLFNGSASNPATLTAVNCELGSGMHVVPSDTVSSPEGALKVKIINCDSGATGYRNEWYDFAGNVTTNTTFTLSGGATDGVEAVSHAYASNSNASIIDPLEGPVLSVWNALTSGSHTATVEIESTGTLNNNDIWLELEYLGSASHPLGTYADDSIATPITTSAAQTSSSATWSGSLGSAVKQKLQVTFAPAMVGLVQGRVKLAKASTTVYVDPVLTIS